MAQVVWYDEMQIEQSGLSSCHISKKQVRFRRDMDGKYNPDGEYGEEKTERTFKYSKQGKFCLGVAAIKRKSLESIEGVRCKSISYTNKKKLFQIKNTKKESQKKLIEFVH